MASHALVIVTICWYFCWVTNANYDFDSNLNHQNEHLLGGLSRLCHRHHHQNKDMLGCGYALSYDSCSMSCVSWKPTFSKMAGYIGWLIASIYISLDVSGNKRRKHVKTCPICCLSGPKWPSGSYLALKLNLYNCILITAPAMQCIAMHPYHSCNVLPCTGIYYNAPNFTTAFLSQMQCPNCTLHCTALNYFLATLVALHFTPVSKWVSQSVSGHSFGQS